MSDPPTGLGGRLALADPSSLTGPQRELFDRVMTSVVPLADKAGFHSTTAEGRLIGPFNPCQLNPAISAQFLKLQFTEQQHTSLSERVRQVVVLTVGAVWRADYELYAHSAAARRAGLTDAAIQTLVNGGMPGELTKEEKIAHRVADRLSTSHHVEDELYRDAEETFGAAGVMEIATLVGIYHTVCGLLSVLAVPAPEPQPAQSISRSDDL
jgi:4-carboxymuconolactone decarboxylase